MRIFQQVDLRHKETQQWSVTELNSMKESFGAVSEASPGACLDMIWGPGRGGPECAERWAWGIGPKVTFQKSGLLTCKGEGASISGATENSKT